MPLSDLDLHAQTIVALMEADVSMKLCHVRMMHIAILLVMLCALTSCGRTARDAVVASSDRQTPSDARPIAPPKDQPELVLQYSQSDRPLDVAFAARAPILASSNEDGRVDIWDTRSWTLERTIDTGSHVMSRNYNTKGIALSPDGRSLTYLTDAGEVQIWNTSSGSLVKRLPQPLGLPVSVKWSPDGRRIAAGSTDAVRIWNVASGKVIRSFPAAGDVAFSRDGKILGTAGEGSAFLFDIASGRKIRSFRDRAGVSWPIAISPSGRYVATGGEDPNWDPGPLPRDEDGNEYAPSESFYSHELRVKIWDARTGRRLKMLPGHNNLGGGTQVLQFTPDGRRLFSAGDGGATLWDVGTSRSIRSFVAPGSSALSSDGKMIAVAGGPLSAYSVATGASLIRLHAPPLPIRSLAFSCDGKTLAAGDQGGSSTNLRLWNVTKGRLDRALDGPPPDLHDVGFLPASKVFSNSTNGTYVWDDLTGKLLAKYKGPTGSSFMDVGSPLWQLLTPDGAYLVNESSGGWKKSYVFRSLATGKVRATISPAYGGSLGDAVFSPDGRYFAVRTDSRPGTPTIEVWDIRTGEKVSEIDDIGKGGVLLVFSPDGKRLAGSLPSPVQMPEGKLVTDNKLAIWDTASGKTKQQLILGKEPARALAFSADGLTLAAGIGSDIHLYSAETLRDTGSMATDKSPISALAFSSDNVRIAAGHEDGRVRLWDVGSRGLLITMLGFATEGQKVSPDWIAYTPDGHYDWPPGAARLVRWRYKGKLHPAERFASQLQRKDLLR